VSGLELLRIEFTAARAMFVLADKQKRGAALRSAFARDVPAPGRSLLRARRRLVRGVRLARAATSRCVTGSELAEHWAAVGAARRAGVAP